MIEELFFILLEVVGGGDFSVLSEDLVLIYFVVCFDCELVLVVKVVSCDVVGVG